MRTSSTPGSACSLAAARAAIRLSNVAGRAADETSIELAALRAARTFGESVARGLPLVRGVPAFVRSAAGIARLGIVTRAPRRDVELILSFSGLADSFECVVAAEDYSGPEPACDPFHIAFARMSEGRAVRVGGNIALVASLNAVARARGPPSPARGGHRLADARIRRRGLRALSRRRDRTRCAAPRNRGGDAMNAPAAAPGFENAALFSSVEEEYAALRGGAGVVDRSARLRLLVGGTQAAETITGLVTNDVGALRPGAGLYAAALTAKGKGSLRT